jgi:DNA-binding transcriptional LysR family regulator
VDLLARIETFAAVAEQRNFTRAAEEVGIPQPLLSRRIKSLEDAWGNELFDRSRRQIELTQFAELVLPYAQDLVRRVRHLEAVIASAAATLVHVVGVPPDCPPAALARIIRAASEHGLAINVHEAPSHTRAAGLGDGTFDLALLREPAGVGGLTVELGLASSTGNGETWRRPVRLDALRPRRLAAGAGPPALLVLPEDHVERFLDHLHRAVGRAGLPSERVQIASSTAAAAAEVLAGRALLLCDARLARHHRLSWSPLADPTLHRSYRVVLAGQSALGADTLEWLTPLLGTAIGAAPPERDREPDRRARLAPSA